MGTLFLVDEHLLCCLIALLPAIAGQPERGTHRESAQGQGGRGFDQVHGQDIDYINNYWAYYYNTILRGGCIVLATVMDKY